ncbi:unnamed protein product, partial [Brenthis ino]
MRGGSGHPYLKTNMIFDLINSHHTNSKEKSSIRNVNSRTSTGTKPGINRDVRDKPSTIPSRGFSRPRPSSPKGRRSPHPSFY